MNAWQKCPVCDGSGVYNTMTSTNDCNPCPVCKGARIISTVTGLPPAGGVQHLTSENTNQYKYRDSNTGYIAHYGVDTSQTGR